MNAKDETKMTDKERLIAIFEGHIKTTEDNLKDHQARFGEHVLCGGDERTAKVLAETCQRLFGQKEAFELAKALVESEL